mgnify:CR=1 FL=1
MNRRVLSKYDIMTVGETPGATVENAPQYAGLDGKELNMVFQFDHVGIGDGPWASGPPSATILCSSRKFSVTGRPAWTAKLE